jgi:uncharacterized protein YqgV (UPF0045/DUF77 family)
MTDTQTTARPPAADVDLEDVRDVAAYAELIARVLSGMPLPQVGGYRTTIMQTFEQAAAAIRQLAAALEQAQVEAKADRRSTNEYMARWHDAEAEVERLREALERIYHADGQPIDLDRVSAAVYARRALHPEPEA